MILMVLLHILDTPVLLEQKIWTREEVQEEGIEQDNSMIYIL